MMTEPDRMEVKTVAGVTIYVNSKGRFSALIDGKEVSRTSLRAIERLIEQQTHPLHVMVTGDWTWHVREDDITHATGDNLKSAKSSYRWRDYVFVYDEVGLAELIAITEEHEALKKRREAVMKRLTRVTAKNLEGLRQQQNEKVEPPDTT